MPALPLMSGGTSLSAAPAVRHEHARRAAGDPHLYGCRGGHLDLVVPASLTGPGINARLGVLAVGLVAFAAAVVDVTAVAIRFLDARFRRRRHQPYDPRPLPRKGLAFDGQGARRRRPTRPANSRT